MAVNMAQWRMLYINSFRYRMGFALGGQGKNSCAILVGLTVSFDR